MKIMSSSTHHSAFPRLAPVAGRMADALRAGTHSAVVGAPGTGKTTVLRAVFNEMLRSGVRHADEVLVLTPNRESAAELRDGLGAEADSAALGLPGPGPLGQALRQGPAARSIHSFAFGLVGAQSAVAQGTTLRFVSGPDQDNLLASLLGGYESGLAPAPDWPERFGPEVRATAGFRNQLREILNELMGRGYTQQQVAQAAAVRGRPEWQVVARVLQDYADQLAIPGFGGVDTAEVFEQARWVLADEHAQGTAAAGPWSFSGEVVPRFVLIDAVQDIPDAALGMLNDLAGLGARFGLCASPDTGTQGFRGARGDILDAMTDSAGFACAPIVLEQDTAWTRGTGQVRTVVDDLARRISSRLGLGHVPRSAGMLPAGPSQVAAQRVGSAAERTRRVAAQLRSWHAAGVDWEQCAVITRTSGTARALEGELEYLGIPVATGMQALGVDPATAPLLQLLAEPAPGPAERSRQLRMLLGGVYIGLDPIALRGVERELAGLLARDGNGSADPEPGAKLPDAGTEAATGAETDSAEPRVDGPAVPEPGVAGPATSGTAAPPDVWSRALDELAPSVLPAPVARAATLLKTAAVHATHDPHTALWALWQATDVADAWRARALDYPADPAGERIDAVLRLMTLAEKDAERDGHTARAFALDVLEQRFAQDSLARRADAQHVLVVAAAAAAHREFERVIVVDLEEGVWPNPRVRGSVFAADALLDELRGISAPRDSGTAYRESRRATIVDEARLALSAMSRARSELVLVAVDDGDTQPGVLFDTAAAAVANTVAVNTDTPGRPAPPDEDGLGTAAGDGTQHNTQVSVTQDSVPAGVADDVADPDLSYLVDGQPLLSTTDVAAYARHRFESALPDTPEEAEWARLLQALRAQGIRAADPDGWLDWQEVSLQAPVLGEGDVAGISPSAVELFHDCQLKWLLTRHGGQSTGTTAQYLGTLIHAIAEKFPQGGLAQMLAEYETRFAQLEFGSAWERDREYEAGREMVHTLDDYFAGRAEQGFRLVGVEGTISAADTSTEHGGPWRINGRIDRLERDADGRLYVVDFKTGRKRPTAAEAAANPQLGTYQVALSTTDNRATFRPPADSAEQATSEAQSGSGGGELVFLRYPGTMVRGTPSNVRSQPALADTENPDWARELVESTAAGMRSAVFTATPSRTTCTGCPVKASCPAYAGEEDQDR